LVWLLMGLLHRFLLKLPLAWTCVLWASLGV
jgi:hypothetical protein